MLPQEYMLLGLLECFSMFSLAVFSSSSDKCSSEHEVKPAMAINDKNTVLVVFIIIFFELEFIIYLYSKVSRLNLINVPTSEIRVISYRIQNIIEEPS